MVIFIIKNQLIYTIFAYMEKNNKKIAWLKRYIKPTFVLVAGYLAFVLFFNENSIAKSFEYDKIIDSLENEISIYQDTIKHYIHLNERLNNDPEAMEQVVREQYHMNRVNEDVYVFE